MRVQLQPRVAQQWALQPRVARRRTHTSSLLNSASIAGKVAGAVLVRETVRHCEELTFARHRDAWCTALLAGLQQNAKSDGADRPAEGSSSSCSR